MSAELRLKKLRGSGGYVMASVTDEQQMKGNLGGPDLFLAPVGRLDENRITKYFCNTCEKEFEGSPKIQYENPNEVVAENLVLIEKGQYLCSSCNTTLAEYREFKKQDETGEIGVAKPMEEVSTQSERITSQLEIPPPESTFQTPPTFEPESTAEAQATEPESPASVSSIEGLQVYDENAVNIGRAKQVGVDSNQSVVLIIVKNDGLEASISWNRIRKIGEIIMLGTPESGIVSPTTVSGTCSSCGFTNKEGSKFCEQCGNKL